jgi:four helix bundle protein
MMYHSFEDLEVWKRGCQLAVLVYEALKDTREFGLRDQMQRAAVSIPSNIAEGAERGGKDFERFLRMARGSAAELRTQLYIARRIGILADEPFSHLIPEVKRISKMLTGLARSLADPSDRKPKTEDRKPERSDP